MQTFLGTIPYVTKEECFFWNGKGSENINFQKHYAAKLCEQNAKLSDRKVSDIRHVS